MSLDAKTALVTGAAKRLGAEVARTLHQNGANLIIHYRNSKQAAEALVRALDLERPGSARALGADLADDDELAQLAANACSAFGGLDLLVNNASSFYPTPFGAIDRGAFDDLVASNFRAPLLLAQACYPALKQSRGSIVNLVDIYASKPLAGHSVYCAAKAANQMLVESLALELAPEVRVNGVAPGAILWPDGDFDEAQQQSTIEKIPLRRTGRPGDIAAAVLFLATSDYISGETIRVDGGRQLT